MKTVFAQYSLDIDVLGYTHLASSMRRRVFWDRIKLAHNLYVLHSYGIRTRRVIPMRQLHRFISSAPVKFLVYASYFAQRCNG